jgi:hypothetical protein
MTTAQFANAKPYTDHRAAARRDRFGDVGLMVRIVV